MLNASLNPLSDHAQELIDGDIPNRHRVSHVFDEIETVDGRTLAWLAKHLDIKCTNALKLRCTSRAQLRLKFH